MGRPVVIAEDRQVEMKEKFIINQFNLLATDLISANRSLPDVRMEAYVMFCCWFVSLVFDIQNFSCICPRVLMEPGIFRSWLLLPIPGTKTPETSTGL